MDGDNKADTLSNGKISKDINGDGDFKDPGEYEVSLSSNMNVDEIFVCTLAAVDKNDDKELLMTLVKQELPITKFLMVMKFDQCMKLLMQLPAKKIQYVK